MTEALLGTACGNCDTFNPLDAEVCSACQSALRIDDSMLDLPQQSSLSAAVSNAAAAAPQLIAEPAPPLEGLMEQARNYVCRECSSPVPSGHKFCGACGGTVPEDIQNLREEYFGPMQIPGKARLVLIHSQSGAKGNSYFLRGVEHVTGREGGTETEKIVFEGDAWLNPRHANFIYRGDKLFVRDEGSVNGVYVRVSAPTPLGFGDHFMCGRQVFRLDENPDAENAPDAQQTYLYTSPQRTSAFRVTQVIVGGADGMVHCAHENTITIGRENCDMNFAEDLHLSPSHASVEQVGPGAFSLTDGDSRNGTFVRVKEETELGDGDYLFVGQQLLRVEMTH